MDFLHIYPAQAQGNVETIRNTWVQKFREQHTQCTDARSLVETRGDNWVGGRGGTGRLPQASNEFLGWLAGEINNLTTSQSSFLGEIDKYLTALGGFAGTVRAADDGAAEEFNNIMRDLDAKGSY